MYFTTKQLQSSLALIDLKCQYLRPPSKQAEYRTRTMAYAVQKGRFLSKEDFSKLFTTIIEMLEDMHRNYQVVMCNVNFYSYFV